MWKTTSKERRRTKIVIIIIKKSSWRIDKKNVSYDSGDACGMIDKWRADFLNISHYYYAVFISHCCLYIQHNNATQTHVYIRIHTHVYTHVYIHTYIHTRTHVYTHTHVHRLIMEQTAALSFDYLLWTGDYNIIIQLNWLPSSSHPHCYYYYYLINYLYI